MAARRAWGGNGQMYGGGGEGGQNWVGSAVLIRLRFDFLAAACACTPSIRTVDWRQSALTRPRHSPARPQCRQIEPVTPASDFVSGVMFRSASYWLRCKAISGNFFVTLPCPSCNPMLATIATDKRRKLVDAAAVQSPCVALAHSSARWCVCSRRLSQALPPN